MVPVLVGKLLYICRTTMYICTYNTDALSSTPLCPPGRLSAYVHTKIVRARGLHRLWRILSGTPKGPAHLCLIFLIGQSPYPIILDRVQGKPADRVSSFSRVPPKPQTVGLPHTKYVDYIGLDVFFQPSSTGPPV